MADESWIKTLLKNVKGIGRIVSSNNGELMVSSLLLQLLQLPLSNTNFSTFDLGENQKRWVVIGISLNKLMLPLLRKFVGKEILKHYSSLKSYNNIDKQVYPSHLKKDGSFDLNYGSINNNWYRHKRHSNKYDYKVNTAEDLGKLYLEPKMAKFTGFDNTCDLSAVLGILANASVFHLHIQIGANNVRSKVRNEWGHCNFDHWTEGEFGLCFQLMETFIRSLGLPKVKEQQLVNDLKDWERKGIQLCMGCPVDKDLMDLVSTEVTNLQQDVEEVKKTNKDEAKKINDSLLCIRDEIENFYTRLSDIEKQMDFLRKEQLEKNQKLSCEINDLSEHLTTVGKRQDTIEQNTARLDEKQSDLESTVSSVTSNQRNLNFKVDNLGSRVQALEERGFMFSVNAKVLQLPSRNACFCGRDSELEAIAAQRENSNCVIQSGICGLGGVGKTSLAVEYLWRYKNDYPGGIFWISGENNDLFQVSVGELARQVGSVDQEFSISLSKTLEWLQRREELWCLVIDNLDELELSPDMRKLLTGHWKQTARGHIIITTRREPTEVGEETGIKEDVCIELKCMNDEEGIQFLCMRTGKSNKEADAMRELVKELDGLPLALDQAAAYIRCLQQSVKEYVNKYKEQKLRVLKKKKARHLVENTSPDRLAVHTTWLLNFEHISRISNKMDLGQAPALLMEVSAFLGPDDIPYEVICNELMIDDNVNLDKDFLDPAEMVHLLTKFSLFQKYGRDSLGVHRLVQEVIRDRMEKTQKERVLSCATRLLHQALVRTHSPAEVCKSFVEHAVFSVENPQSLHLWGRLASHATYLQDHLINFCERYKESADKLLHTEKTVRLLNEAAVFFSVSQQKIKAQEIHKLKLNVLVHLQKSSPEEDTILPHYFIDIPLTDKNYKLVSHCMSQVIEKSVVKSCKETEEEVDRLREQGNVAVKNKNFGKAVDVYSRAIEVLAVDHRLFSNRALCFLKLGQPQEALDDCEKCLSLKPYYSKALQRKAWALHDLVKSGSNFSYLAPREKAAAALAIYNDSQLRGDKTFLQMFPEVAYREIYNEQHLAFVLMTAEKNETLLLHEGLYTLTGFVGLNDLQIVGLGQKVILTCTDVCRVTFCECYFENIIFPKGNAPVVCFGKDTTIYMNHCQISGGFSSCEDFPECNGGPGCTAKLSGKRPCDRTDMYGTAEPSGISGSAGLQIREGSSGHVENCFIHDCGGGGAIVAGECARLEVRNCEVLRNHQAGLEAREGGRLTALRNRIFNNGFHGFLIGPDAGECNIDCNKIFENAKEGILAITTTNKVVIRNNDIHHNGPFGISLDDDSHLLIENNKIFLNGFWGIFAKSRTSAQIRRNVISANKCGGIFIGVNYSGRVYLESNVVKDHSGPWLEYQLMEESPPVEIESYNVPLKEKSLYSTLPNLKDNNEFNNKEGMFHPKEVAERWLHSGCTYCHQTNDNKGRFKKCSDCHIASYCNKECQRKHWPTHSVLCKVLRSRYSVIVEMKACSLDQSSQTFGSHLKGIGTGPKPKRSSRQRFIVKIQTLNLNSHPLQLLRTYDKSLTINCFVQSPDLFNVIMECGVLGQLYKFTSKKCFFWATFTDEEKQLRIFLDHLAAYQEW